MKISYRKLWAKIALLEINKADFKEKVGLSGGTLTKLNKNESVSLEVLMRICQFLKCDIGDVCEFVSEK